VSAGIGHNRPLMTDVDRNAILARRALFISAALAGLACTSTEGPTPQKGSSEGVATTSEGVERKRPSWSEVMAKAPPLDVPAGIGDSERGLLEGLNQELEAKYELLRGVWDLQPDCSPSEAECTVWTQSVKAMLDAWPDEGPLCSYAPEWTATLEQRAQGHERYLVQLRELLLADLDASAKRWSGAGEAWQRHREPLLDGPPRPCLDCARPKLSPILISVPFATNEAALGEDLGGLDTVLVRQRNNGTAARLIVRGHADPKEQDGDRLAKERAEAVAKWLIDAGLPKEDVQVRGYGSTLVVSRESAENQRVDFELVAR
jgi:outer membrane protein OmpA-like peptidoglycan-associated protein